LSPAIDTGPKRHIIGYEGTMKSACLVLFLFLACAGAAGAGPYDNGSPGQYDELPEIPKRFVRFDAVDLGFFGLRGGWGAFYTTAANATCVLGKPRFGVALADVYNEPDYGLTIAAILPLRLGYSLWSNPKRTLFCYAAVPDLYVEASGSFLDASFQYSPARSWPCAVTSTTMVSELALREAGSATTRIGRSRTSIWPSSSVS
jgi:hypothetical protein